MSFSSAPPELRVHAYELRARGGTPLNSQSTTSVRSGALIEATFAAGLRGYADVHPWPELGDVPLAGQLVSLRSGHLTRLAERSLHYARLDAELRARGRNAFEGLEVPPNHALLVSREELTANRVAELAAEGFTRIKLKGGRELEADARAILAAAPAFVDGMRLRLDFNGAADAAGVDAFLAALGDVRARIDFIEDPFPFDPVRWGELQTRHRVAFALDRDAEPWVGKTDLASVWIVKPAVQDPERFVAAAESPLQSPARVRMVFTSYLDHPLGQLCAAYEAARRARETGMPEECGLISHRVYDPNPFSEALGDRGPRLRLPEGTGFGFDTLLAGLAWAALPNT